jgi:hypothetical protein
MDKLAWKILFAVVSITFAVYLAATWLYFAFLYNQFDWISERSEPPCSCLFGGEYNCTETLHNPDSNLSLSCEAAGGCPPPVVCQSPTPVVHPSPTPVVHPSPTPCPSPVICQSPTPLLCPLPRPCPACATPLPCPVSVDSTSSSATILIVPVLGTLFL